MEREPPIQGFGVLRDNEPRLDFYEGPRNLIKQIVLPVDIWQPFFDDHRANSYPTIRANRHREKQLLTHLTFTAPKDTALEKLLTDKMLPEKKTDKATSGLLYFALEKVKVKNLQLEYGGKENRITLRFKEK